MTTDASAPANVVYDCNIYVQSLHSPTGPAAACIEQAILGKVRLFWNDAVIAEIRSMAAHPHLRRIGITENRIDALMLPLWATALYIRETPSQSNAPTA